MISTDTEDMLDFVANPSDWVGNVAEMHEKFGVHAVVESMDPAKLRTYLQFRIAMLQEELDEVKKGFAENDPEQIVDGIIDLGVFAVGTLDIFQVNGDKAWQVVHAANMLKEPGVKQGRPNPYGLPDLIKPEGWTAPSHEGNHGRLTKALCQV